MRIAKIALITALIGTLILAVLAYYLEPKTQEISEIDESTIDSFVKVSGEVMSIGQKGNYFDLSDKSGSIRVVSFQRLEISKGDKLEVIGKVDEYYGKLEIEAQDIKR
ncbi:exodeoxyribonuclease VII large subunit [Nanoarchaeota archaeon]